MEQDQTQADKPRYPRLVKEWEVEGRVMQEWEVRQGLRRITPAGNRPRHEQTIILGNKPITLEHVASTPMTFESRSQLRKYLKENDMYSAYFSD